MITVYSEGFILSLITSDFIHALKTKLKLNQKIIDLGKTFTTYDHAYSQLQSPLICNWTLYLPTAVITLICNGSMFPDWPKSVNYKMGSDDFKVDYATAEESKYRTHPTVGFLSMSMS